jgi:ribosome-binding protein aMBF1 (putative translation factor)
MKSLGKVKRLWNMCRFLTIVRSLVNQIPLYSFHVRSDNTREIICSKVSEILRDERRKRGLSMTEIAQRAGLSQQMVSYVERGLRNPTLDTMLRISDALDIDLTDVIRRACKAAVVRKTK